MDDSTPPAEDLFKWSVPEELQSSPIPRPVRLTQRGKINISSNAFVVLSMTGVIFFSYSKMWMRYRDLDTLGKSGLTTKGVLTQKNITPKSGRHIFYTYQVNGQGFQNSAYVGRSYFDNLVIGAPLDVLFLAENPKISKLGFETAPRPSLLFLLWPLLGSVGLISAIRKVQKQKNLLSTGTVAPARVVKVSRNKSTYTVHYTFTDELGHEIKGKVCSLMGSVPIVGNTTTALYSPTDPTQNTLYIVGTTEIIPSSADSTHFNTAD